jgi:outer membrane protein assembly factor BamE (lipoprotein component of BamABCDE complex)
MREFVRSGFCVTLALVLAGCAGNSGVRDWWTLSEVSFKPITPGAGKADVERLVGEPIMTMTFRNLGEEVWDYRYLNMTRVYMTEVHFDLQGKVKYYKEYLDPVFNSRGRGH